jgi:hypothetical protein
MSAASLPKKMKALYYEKPREYSVKEVELPVVRDGDVLIKGEFSGNSGLSGSGRLWCLRNGPSYS